MAPYLGLYLESKGFSLLEISQLSALLMLTKVLAPNVWGHLADHSGKRLMLVRCGTFATMVSYLGFFWAQHFWHFAIVIASFSFFWNAVLAQFEVVTLFNLGEQHQRYSRIRLWGSIGFIVSVSLLGYVFEYAGVTWFPVALLVIITLILCASLQRFKEPGLSPHAQNSFGQFWLELKQRKSWVFFTICFLLQISHGAYYTYFSIYLEELGYSKSTIGWLWALGVVAEVVLFLVMHRWLNRVSDAHIMAAALVITSIRWLLIGSGADNLIVLLLAQLLHAFSFGAMHSAAIHFVHRNFSPDVQGKAQAMYSSVGFGLGGALGALLSGYLVSAWSYTGAFYFSGFVAFAAFYLIYKNTHHF